MAHAGALLTHTSPVKALPEPWPRPLSFPALPGSLQDSFLLPLPCSLGSSDRELPEYGLSGSWASGCCFHCPLFQPTL